MAELALGALGITGLIDVCIRYDCEPVVQMGTINPSILKLN
jgi:hypothetical protein